MQTQDITFKSEEHENRFLAAMQALGKIYAGKLDPEYASALYIICADLGTWNKAQGYIDREGIDFEEMLQKVDFSGGYSVLILLAGHLFNNQQRIEPLEFLRLDESNFRLALDALKLRRYSMSI